MCSRRRPFTLRRIKRPQHPIDLENLGAILAGKSPARVALELPELRIVGGHIGVPWLSEEPSVAMHKM